MKKQMEKNALKMLYPHVVKTLWNHSLRGFHCLFMESVGRVNPDCIFFFNSSTLRNAAGGQLQDAAFEEVIGEKMSFVQDARRKLNSQNFRVVNKTLCKAKEI